MGLLPFMALADATKNKQEQEVAARRREEQQKKEAEAKFNSTVSKLRYYTPEKRIRIKVEEISDKLVKEFLEGFFEFVQTKTDEKIASLTRALNKKRSEREDITKQIKPYNQRQKKATNILRDCLAHTRKTYFVSISLPYFSEPSAAGKLMNKFIQNSTLYEINKIAQGYISFNPDFDLEAVHGIPLEHSNFYKELMEYKKEFYDEVARKEKKLVPLQQQLKHTIWLPKRKEIKNSIKIISDDIALENRYFSFLNGKINAYCEFYKTVFSLDKDSLQPVLDAINDGINGARKQLGTSELNINFDIENLEREINRASFPNYSHLVTDYVLEHPEYTEEVLDYIEKGIKIAEVENREANGKKTHVYDYGPTAIDGKIETDKMCKLVRNAKNIIAERENE